MIKNIFQNSFFKFLFLLILIDNIDSAYKLINNFQNEKLILFIFHFAYRSLMIGFSLLFIFRKKTIN